MLSGESVSLVVVFAALLLSIAVAAWLAWLWRRARRQLRLQAARLADLERREVSTFLTREINHTMHRVRPTAKPDAQQRSLAALRLRWLKIEQRALLDEGDGRSDYAAVERMAQPLLALFRTRGSGPKAEVSNEQEKNRAIIQLQKEIMATLQDQIAALERQGGKIDPELSGRLAPAFGSLERLQREVELPGHHPAAGAESSGLLVISETAGAPQAAQSLLGEMENYHRDHIEELKRMRDINMRQRKLILQLEKKIALMQAGSAERMASQALLDSLNGQLRDYESCTATLELEADHLRSRIQALNGIIKHVGDSRETGRGILLSQDLLLKQEAGLRNWDGAGQADLQQRYRRLLTTVRKLAELALADSIDRAGALSLSWFAELNVDAVIYIRGGSRQYWLSSDSTAIDGRIRQLLQSTVRGVDDAWTDVRGGTIFSGTAVHIFVENSFGEADRFGELKQALAPSLEILDVLLSHIDQQRQGAVEVARLRKLLEQMARGISTIDLQHQYLLEENARIGDKLHDEMNQYFDELSLSGIQQSCIEGMLEDFKSELVLLSRAAGAIHRELQQLHEAVAGPESLAGSAYGLGGRA